MLFVSIFVCLPYKLPDPRLSFIACILRPHISSGNPTMAPFENHVIIRQLLYIFSTFSNNCLTFLPFLETWFTFFPSLETWQPSSVGITIFFHSTYTCMWYVSCLYAQSLSHVRLCSMPWTVGCWAPLSMEFSSKNTRAGYHFLLQEFICLPCPHCSFYSIFLAFFINPPSFEHYAIYLFIYFPTIFLVAISFQSLGCCL